ncbi:MAG TPA: hypothetical protein VJ866_15190 [Pyrinomonadaceae bacterium]|nr:hypothetical protein [Pyrinomonadaceae bacterium]
MDKFVKALSKSAEEAIKELKKEGLATSDWKLDPVVYEEGVSPDDSGVSGALHVRARSKKTGDTVLEFHMTGLHRAPETPDVVKRTIVEQARKVLKQGAGNENPNT